MIIAQEVRSSICSAIVVLQTSTCVADGPGNFLQSMVISHNQGIATQKKFAF